MKVDLINHTDNGDLLVVNAARCSFDKEHEEFDIEKRKSLSERERVCEEQ